MENLKTVGRQLNSPETELQREFIRLIRKSGTTPYATAAVHNQEINHIYKLMKGKRTYGTLDNDVGKKMRIAFYFQPTTLL